MRGSGGPWSCSRITSIAEVDRRRVAHLRPEDEESSDRDDGSSSSARERRRGERASEAGSSVAKPRDRWRAPSPNGCASGSSWEHRSICRGKALWVGEVVLFDEGSAEAILVPRGRADLRSVCARGATGSVRGRSPALCMAENARPRWRRRTAAPGSLSHSSGRRGDPCANRLKLEARRQARAQPGSNRRKAVRRRTGEPDLGRGSTLRSAPHVST